MGLKAADLVEVWEQGFNSGRAERAQMLLCRAYPDISHEMLDALPLGKSNEMLLQLREQIFGPFLESVVRCPQCRETLEIKLDIRKLQHDHASENLLKEWQNGNLRIRFRVPTGGDLRYLENCKDPQEACGRLIER